MTTGSPVQFLYPKSRQFPFDAVCEQIVRALEARNWSVPDIDVSFSAYGSGAQKLRYVNTISSAKHDFEICFSREQGLLPGGKYNDVAATNSVRIPRLRLTVYSDESGPTLWTYVGDDWSRDRANFPGGIDAKLHGKPRRYLVYNGVCGYGARRASRLVAGQDYREYAPEGEEPSSFDFFSDVNQITSTERAFHGAASVRRMLQESLEEANTLRRRLSLPEVDQLMPGSPTRSHCWPERDIEPGATISELRSVLYLVLKYKHVIEAEWLKTRNVVSDLRWKSKRLLYRVTAPFHLIVWGTATEDLGDGRMLRYGKEQARAVGVDDRIALYNERALLLDRNEDSLDRVWSVMDHEQDGDALLSDLKTRGLVQLLKSPRTKDARY